MSAMSNLHTELSNAMLHVANKINEAVVDGWGDTMEATCRTSIELLQVCADAFEQIRTMDQEVAKSGN